MTNDFPLPGPTVLSAPHWDGCKEGELRVQRCRACRSYIFIPKPNCPQCFGRDLAWVVSSGRGTVYSYTQVHRSASPAFAAPYVIAIVELDEGWHMLTNIVDCSLERVVVGMRVRVAFKKISDEITLPFFVPEEKVRAD